jgi:hypothetical protein
METEQDRLVKLYGEMSDEHLLDLNEEQDDLTDEARLVLAQELRRREITPEPPGPPGERTIVPTVEPEREEGFGGGVPGIIPSGAAAVEQALEPADTPRDDGLARLISFYDGMQLSKACEILEDAGLEPSIEPIAGDAMSGVPPRFEVWLDIGDIELAQVLLRAKMGLFPVAEVDEDDDGEPEAGLPEGDLIVAEFDSSIDAEHVRALLADAGIEARVDSDPDDGDISVVTVAAKHQERALELVADEMGLG